MCCGYMVTHFPTQVKDHFKQATDKLMYLYLLGDEIEPTIWYCCGSLVLGEAAGGNDEQ